MYHVREFLSELPVHMELDNFYARLEKEDKMRDSLASAGSEVVKPGMSLTVRAKSLIGNFVTNADEEILRKVDDVARKICNKVSSLLSHSNRSDVILAKERVSSLLDQFKNFFMLFTCQLVDLPCSSLQIFKRL